MVQKVIANPDLPKVSSPGCVAAVVLRNCDPELSFILAELLSKCLKETCFPDYWKVSLVVLYLTNLEKATTL